MANIIQITEEFLRILPGRNCSFTEWGALMIDKEARYTDK